MKPGQEAHVYQLTWQKQPTPWYFPLLLALFSVVNIFYLGWILGYAYGHGIIGWMLFFVELYRVVVSLIAFYCLYTIVFPVYEKPLKDRTVHVLIPTLNEDLTVVGKTIVEAKKIRGVRQVLVLDDGNRRVIKDFAKKSGVLYVARVSHEHAKAGNLNEGLKHTDAEFLITLDADHVPEPEFIERTLGYFRDPNVAFVQTPQVFYNRDSFQHRKHAVFSEWSEQTMFYESIQPAKNTHNAAFFCGSSAILRRSALDSIGGFATGTATEDIHTAIRIHQKRWKSVYINEKLAYGLAPDDLKEYYRQRVRWGAGSLGLLFRTSDSPFWCKGLSFPQRLHYINSMLGFTQGEIKLIYFLLPIMSMLWFAFLPVSVLLMIIVTVSFLLFSVWMVTVYSRGTYHFLYTEQYNIANILSNLASLKGVIRVQKKFGVSIKTKRTMENSYVSYILTLFTVFLSGFEVGGFWVGYVTFQGNLTFLWTRSIGLALFWNLYNIALISSLLLFIRQHHRKQAVSKVETLRGVKQTLAFYPLRVKEM